MLENLEILRLLVFGNKMITTGEGGMMGFKSKAHKLKAEFLEIMVCLKNKYWHDYGFNFRITNLQSSIGCAQLERIQWFIRNKLNLAKNYKSKLSKFEFITLPVCMEMFKILIGYIQLDLIKIL